MKAHTALELVRKKTAKKTSDTVEVVDGVREHVLQENE